MSDNKITQDQLEPNVMEELESGIGDLSTLSTENKDSLVAAVTEIYGKNVIAEAIGEPLAVTDTFSEMGSEINSLLSSFKTNMMNSGVTVESGDKFKQLIEKIKGLTEGEGNKGIQFAEGTFENLIIDNTDNDTSVPLQVNLDLDFVPNMLFIKIGHSISADLISGSAEAIICNMFDNTFYSNYSTSYGYTTTYVISDITQTKCTVTRKLNYNTIDEDTYLRTTILGFYAIGVGEEDTTLRDSLASILEEEGVDVTEEDDMASLISKVDEEFDRKNIQEYQFDANQEGYPVNILSYTDKITSNSTTWTIFKQETLPLSGIFKCVTIFTKLGIYATPASVRLGVVDTDGVETFYDTFSQSSTNGTTTANWIIDIQQDSTINFYGMVESSGNTLSISNVNISTNIVCN